MQAVKSRKVMKDRSYKMEENDNNSEMIDGDCDYDSVELLSSKSGDSLLISLVQNYPHLYVKTSKNLRDNSLRDNSWQEISAILEQPASECLKRWTRLREKYTKEKRSSEQNIRNGTVVTNKESWAHFGEMGFLAQHIIGRRSYRNVNSRIKQSPYERRYSNEAPSSPEHRQSLSSSPAPYTSTSMIVQPPSPSPSTSTAVVPSPELLSPEISESDNIYENCDQQRGEEKDSVIVEDSIPETKTTIDNHQSRNNQGIESSEDLFCKYLASELKKMSANEKKATTRRLLDALFQENT